MKQRLVSFIENEEGVRGGEASVAAIRQERDGDKCVSCTRKCANNDKNMACKECARKQHFNCAGIKTEEERKLME